MLDKPMRIVSDGTALGTKVYGADGAEVKGCITRIEWAIDGERRIGQAKITFDCVDVDLVGASAE